jgi:hypothetical protein
MSVIEDNTIEMLDNFLIEDIKYINIQNGMLKSLSCLNGGTFNDIAVFARLNDTEYRNITARHFNVSNNLFNKLTFINCKIEYLDVSKNKLLKILNFIDCSIYSINASGCCLTYLINLPITLKYLNVENNNLCCLNISKNNIKYLNVKNNRLPKFIKYDCEKVLYDSDDEIEQFNNDDFLESYFSNNEEELIKPLEPIYEKVILNRYKEI